MEIIGALFAEEVRFIPGFEKLFERQVRGRTKTCIATSMTEELFAVADRRQGFWQRVRPPESDIICAL